jgi:sec-independent protein translocase protein TatA
MFGNLGFSEILLILLVVLLLFGAKRIPEIAGSFGKGIREFKKNMTDIGNADVPSAPERPAIRGGESQGSDVKAEESRPEPKRLI